MPTNPITAEDVISAFELGFQTAASHFTRRLKALEAAGELASAQELKDSWIAQLKEELVHD